jgi:hypothetical protein
MTNRRWLAQIAPANEAKAIPATYRLNIHAIPDDPRMIEFLREEDQWTLPGVYRRPVPGERVPDRGPCLTTGQGGNYSDTPAQPLGYPAQPLGYPAQPLGPTLRKNNDVDGDAVGIGDADSFPVVVVDDHPGPRASGAQGVPTTAQIDRASVYQAILKYASYPDQKALELIIQGCLRKQADATTDEIIAAVHSRGVQILSGKISNPVGFMIAAVPECFCGEAFSEWRNLRAAAAAKAAESAEQQAEIDASVAEYLWKKGHH